MTPEELAQFTELAKKYEKGKDKDAVIKIISDHAHEAFQEINDGGRSAANVDNQGKVKGLESQLQAEKAAREKAEADLKELNGKAPDAAALKQKYDQEIAEIRQQAKQEIETAQKATIEERLTTAKKTLEAKLLDKKRDIVPQYASTVLMKDDAVVGRLKPDPTGKVGVLKEGSTDIFLVPPSGGDVFDVLADEVAAKVPADWKSSKVRRGSGTTGSQGGGGSDNVFDQIRTESKAQSEEKAATAKKATGLERLGRRR